MPLSRNSADQQRWRQRPRATAAEPAPPATLPTVNDSPAVSPESLINQARYPLIARSTQEQSLRADVVSRAATELQNDGVAILPNFLTDSAVATLVAEANELRPRGHFSEVWGTPYIGLPDPDVDPRHPRAYQGRTALSAIPYDVFPITGPTRSLYEWDPLTSFVADILGVEALFRYADPLGALNVAVMDAGDELGWHFDQTDFVVSIALQSAESGGDFVNAAHIRTHDDERFDDVAAVLHSSLGEHDPLTQTVPMVPGTLMLFRGRHSLHRVTPIAGPTSRLVALLAYDTKPDTNSSELLKLVRYGRTA